MRKLLNLDLEFNTSAVKFKLQKLVVAIKIVQIVLPYPWKFELHTKWIRAYASV